MKQIQTHCNVSSPCSFSVAVLLSFIVAFYLC